MDYACYVNLIAGIWQNNQVINFVFSLVISVVVCLFLISECDPFPDKWLLSNWTIKTETSVHFEKSADVILISVSYTVNCHHCQCLQF